MDPKVHRVMSAHKDHRVALVLKALWGNRAPWAYTESKAVKDHKGRYRPDRKGLLDHKARSDLKVYLDHKGYLDQRR